MHVIFVILSVDLGMACRYGQRADALDLKRVLILQETPHEVFGAKTFEGRNDATDWRLNEDRAIFELLAGCLEGVETVHCKPVALALFKLGIELGV